MITSVLDFTECVEEEDFYDRIIDALGLGVGYCGRNWSADDIAKVAEIINNAL